MYTVGDTSELELSQLVAGSYLFFQVCGGLIAGFSWNNAKCDSARDAKGHGLRPVFKALFRGRVKHCDGPIAGDLQ